MRDIDQSNMEQDRVKSVDSKVNLLIEKLNFKISVLETRVAKLESKQLDPRDDEPDYDIDNLVYLIGSKVKVRDVQGVWIVESFTVYPEYLIYNLVDQNRKVNLKVNESNIEEYTP